MIYMLDNNYFNTNEWLYKNNENKRNSNKQILIYIFLHIKGLSILI